jgi:hypothetical protein
MRAVPPEDLSKMSDNQILDSMGTGTVDSDHYKHCLNILQVRYMQRTSQSTKRLVWATWALVIATLFLLMGSVFPLILSFITAK